MTPDSEASHPRLVMIGPPASGKSRVGRRIASRLGVNFVDTDALLTARFGPIPDLFAQEGEPWFREREREIVEQCLHEGGVLSLGGGAVTHAETRKDLVAQRVVGLAISEEAVAPRIARSDSRPLLAGGVDAWKRLVAVRQQWYEELADVTVDVSHRDSDDVAQEIVQWLEGVESRDG